MNMLPVERRLAWAGGLITAGLIVEVVSSAWIHPLAFVAFILVACPLALAGMFLFLFSLVSSR